MKINFKDGEPAKERADALIVGIFEDRLDEVAKEIDARIDRGITKIMKTDEFKAKSNTTALLHVFGQLPSERLVLVGLGKKAEFNLEKLRQAAGVSAAFARDKGFKTAVSTLHSQGLEDAGAEMIGQAVAEGTLLALYRFGKYKTEKETVQEFSKQLETLILPERDKQRRADLQKGASAGEKISMAVGHARDMISEPAGVLTPSAMADRAKELARRHGFKCTVLSPDQIKKQGMGAFLAVAQGSHQPPRFIILEHKGAGSEKPLVFVGKAITFDSGGISIKPSEGMEEMKHDMSGGAAVIGALSAAAMLKLPVNIVGLIPATENLPGGGAYRPGDVLRSMSGITIEVISTDAEGRLILSDALAYAARYKPAAIVDLATLTGACVIALGHINTGLMGNNEEFLAKIEAASKETSEKVWRLPLDEEYAEQIKSDIADVKNVGGRPAGTITAGLFLKKFVGDFPWAHLDIAGTAWIKESRPYIPKGATGIGVRLLTQLAKDWK
ncbi:MAG: leucyl aminopeptidase [Candidatus Abyssobacteria bacterium SURF_5]|uniref:Probable cytosol aminopeptidase n=1 Tax=Abyssobacteria bacterium (strain SURF_5) TaxID=2093360 RepID=A0A3A4N6V7_ABYX5|nr:MAG: leucyl aminopeptidase [Candidatus Abyssubacteria bacterium SURF_5]